jgi:predicted enzyme related to lactoylglutathione lyase
MPRVIHFEIPVRDPEKVSEFYRKVFAWDITKWEGPMDYWLVTTGPDKEPGINGAFARKKDMIAEGVVLTVQVDSLEDTIRDLVSAGGSRLTPRSAVPGIGYFSYCKDPEGNVIGMMESDPSAG